MHTLKLILVVVATVDVPVGQDTLSLEFTHSQFLHFHHGVWHQRAIPFSGVHLLRVDTNILEHSQQVVTMHITVEQMVGDKSWGAVSFRPSWPAVFPAIALILYLMARRAILADEKLVRSMDRIR